MTTETIEAVAGEMVVLVGSGDMPRGLAGALRARDAAYVVRGTPCADSFGWHVSYRGEATAEVSARASELVQRMQASEAEEIARNAARQAADPNTPRWAYGAPPRTTTTFTITTDATSATIEAVDLDAAAAQFAASEGWAGIESADDLADHVTAAGGWLTIADSRSVVLRAGER